MKIQGTELQKAGYFLTEVKGLCDNDFMDSGMIEAIAKLIVGYNELNTTTQPQPKLSAEDIDKLVEKYELNVDSFTSCFLVDKDILINICNEYRNQPTPFTPPRTEQEEADRLVKLQFPISCYKECISMLQLRGLSTTFEEKVLTILKGR